MLMQQWRPESALDGINSGSWYHCLPIGIYHWLGEGGCIAVVCEVVCYTEVRPGLNLFQFDWHCFWGQCTAVLGSHNCRCRCPLNNVWFLIRLRKYVLGIQQCFQTLHLPSPWHRWSTPTVLLLVAILDLVWQVLRPASQQLNKLKVRSFVTFCVTRRRWKMYCGHVCLCVCLSVCVCPRPYAHITAQTRM